MRFHAGFSPFRRDTFLCSAKEKYPKERRTRRLVPHFQCGIPCASRHFGRSPNSQDLPRLTACKSSSNRAARSLPKWLRCSAAPTGIQFRWLLCRSAPLSAILSRHPGEGRDPVVLGKGFGFRDTTPNPVWRSRASQGKPDQARALFERNRAERDRELRERRFSREAQDIRA